MTSTEWTILAEAHEALLTAVRDVPADGWERSTPCADWTVTQVLQHAAGDQLAFASFLTGEPGPDENPFAPSGKLGDDPGAVARRAVEASARAFATVAPDTAEVPVPVPPNKLDAATAVGACALDAAVHAWDIALATGRPSPLNADLARRLHTSATVIVEPLRSFGAYAAALPDEPGDDDTARFLRYLGRNPHWTP
ncbi:TIGR03086 family metal-binding protein [Actinomadura atramentaria]|uniref:TIGR03086 family metal-binding protein n=1 Tax=Actinomadura atramentaria TaxID=1990 RepID=UPI00037F6104|nr:TIGR03086 family metal-binding protein [Actinomadura atramentaria]